MAPPPRGGGAAQRGQGRGITSSIDGAHRRGGQRLWRQLGAAPPCEMREWLAVAGSRPSRRERAAAAAAVTLDADALRRPQADQRQRAARSQGRYLSASASARRHVSTQRALLDALAAKLCLWARRRHGGPRAQAADTLLGRSAAASRVHGLVLDGRVRHKIEKTAERGTHTPKRAAQQAWTRGSRMADDDDPCAAHGGPPARAATASCASTGKGGAGDGGSARERREACCAAIRSERAAETAAR